MKKARTLETSHRFFVYDKFKDYGNKNYNKGLYKDAISYYERALSCYKWLEVKDEPDEEEKLGESVLNHRNVDESTKENEIQSKEEDKEEEEKEEPEEQKTIDMQNAFPEMTPEERKQIKEEQKEFRQKYKKFLTTYSDKNVVLHDGDEVKESSDLDMRKSFFDFLMNLSNFFFFFFNKIGKSLLLTVYMSLSCCYMQLSHFNLALQALEDAFAISEKNSQLLFRRAQVGIEL